METIHCSHDTAVVILSYNGRKWHELFLPLICREATEAGYEVVIADNASTDDTLPYIRQHFPDVHTLHIRVNRGFANGYAVALRQITAKYYILLSADFEVTPGWYQPLHRLMIETPGLAACQPRIRYWKERELFEYAGAAGGFMDPYGYLFCRGRIFETLEKDEEQYADNVEVFWASGGCLMVRADLYHQAGGLDPDFYAHMEEVDLCWRLKNMGYRIGYAADSLVYHVGGSVITYGSPQKLYYNFRNSLILLLKNERTLKLLWLLPYRLLLDGVAGARLLFGGKFKEVGVILKAHFHFYGRFFPTLRKRWKTRGSRGMRNNEGRYPKSIVWQYFVLGRKKFSDLNWKSRRL